MLADRLCRMSDDETPRSPGGSNILRHEAGERDFEAPAFSGGQEEIEQHFSRHYGEPVSVFHEIVSDIVHLDVHLIPPSPAKNHWTLFTTGMSDLPMTVPDGSDDFRFAELMVQLPAEWRIDALSVTPPPDDLERWYWPMRWLKQLARLPHEYQTWLGACHTIPNGDPPAPFSPETKLCGWMLLPSVSAEPEARTITLSDGRIVNLYCLYGLHMEELSLKLNKGADSLLDAFDKFGVSEILQLDRQPAVRKKLFGLF